MGIDQLRLAGINADVKTTDFGAWIRNRVKKETSDKGGWNILYTLIDGSYNFTPAGNVATTSTGPKGYPGWVTAP